MKKEKLYKIGAVEERLSEDSSQRNIFAGTIRFWEKEGLIEPTRRTQGKQRLYSEDDIKWIKLLGELSAAGLSIAKMRDELKRERARLKGSEGESNSSAKATSGLVDTLEERRRRNALDIKLDFFYEHLDNEQRKENFYDIDALARLIQRTDTRAFIERAEQYGLLMPEKIDGIKRYSRFDEMVLQVLEFLDLIEPHILDRCKDLVRTVKYLANDIGIWEGFAASRKHAGTTGYNATLYNLIQNHLDSLKELENKQA